MPSRKIGKNMFGRNNNIIAGLDIGTTKITALIANIDENGKLLIEGEGTVLSEGIKNGIVVDLEATTKVIEKALNKAESSANSKIDKVVIGIAGTSIQGQSNIAEINIASPIRGISEDDIANVINKAREIIIPAGRELLHVMVQDFCVDNQKGIKNPLGMSGSRLAVEMHIVSGDISTMQNIYKCVNGAGWRVGNMVLRPLASSLSVLSEDEKNIGVIMADIGGGTTDIAVYSHGSIRHMQIIPIGGDHITADIVHGLRVSRTDAERVKITHGCAIITLIGSDVEIKVHNVVGGTMYTTSQKKILEIIAPRVIEILNTVKEEFDKMQKRYQNPAGVVLTGGVTLLPGVKEVAARMFNLPVRVATPTGYNGFQEKINDPRYSTAVGLLLHELAEREIGTLNNKNIIFKYYDKLRNFMDNIL